MYFAAFLTILLVQLIGVSGDELKPQQDYTLCPERYSCKNSTLGHDEDDERFCRCDSLCKVYDDCCDDYVGSSDSSENKMNLSSNVITCKRLEFNKFYISKLHYIVERCPKEFERGYIKNNCRLQNSRSGNTLTRVPVIGRQSTILYRNFYCAICNGEQDVVFWKGSVGFPRFSGDTEITLDKMRFSPPDGYSIRTCLNVIRTCQPNYRNGKVKKRCTKASQSNSFVISREEEQLWRPIYYRNADCAKCNSVNESRQMCKYFSDRIGAHPIDYSLIVNFSFGFGNKNSMNFLGDVDRSVKKLSSNVRCNAKQIYDPIAEVCRTYRCPPGKKLTSKGSCHG